MTKQPAGKPYYITTAIAYPNGPPHIGHAYEAIATDAIARFIRLDGWDVFFLTGTDEHGIKMLQTAAKENLTPRQLVERNVPRFQAMVKKFNCSNDDFIRTTEARHYRSSEAIWERMEAAGDIYLDKYSGWYSVRDEAYYDESETRLDEKGQRLGPHGTPVEWVEEQSYFFRLSKYGDKLLDLYRRIPDFVLPKERLNEVASFVRGGLQDLSLSRTTFDWGIKVPANPKHIMYVWVDALTNYITAVGFPDTESEKFRKYWPADLHVIGKDIVRFHAVYWPAFLMSAGIEVPRRIFSHGFLFNRGEKMSKSVGNVIDPFALADAYGVDPLRYFLLREVPFGQDGNYSHEAIVARINADLANDLGNLAQRSLSMVARARTAGIERLVTISTRVRRHSALLAIAECFPDVYCSIGTHPHYAHEEADISVAELVACSRAEKIVAIGEAGLDYHYDNSPREAQERGFRTHIDAARKTGLPLVIHSREADDDTARILEEETGRGAFAAVLHCFTGGHDLARRALALGHFISFTGILTFKNSEPLRAIAAELPADRILVETDAPYLAPGKYRGKRNEPAFVIETTKVLAAVRGVSFDAVARQTTANFYRLFAKVPPPAVQSAISEPAPAASR